MLKARIHTNTHTTPVVFEPTYEGLFHSLAAMPALTEGLETLWQNTVYHRLDEEAYARFSEQFQRSLMSLDGESGEDTTDLGTVSTLFTRALAHTYRPTEQDYEQMLQQFTQKDLRVTIIGENAFPPFMQRRNTNETSD